MNTEDILEILESEVYASIYHDGEPYAVVEGLDKAAKRISAALGGRSIQSEGPSESECGGDRPEGERPTNESRTLSDLVNGPQK